MALNNKELLRYYVYCAVGDGIISAAVFYMGFNENFGLLTRFFIYIMGTIAAIISVLATLKFCISLKKSRKNIL